jgi:N-acetylglucosaminyldiphosphoundecaprenol N-acetyl-beta-D-mannosaminyltransferase
MTLDDLPCYHILGTPVRATSYEDLTHFCQERSTGSNVVSVDFSNTQIVTMRRLDPRFREETSRVDFFIPDGMPLIWCLNLQKANLKDRVYGPSFMRHCVTHSPKPYTHYFLGGSETCLKRLKLAFKSWQPEVQIIGMRNGYFKEEDSESIIQEINSLSPDFIWVGLGTPKQQSWIHQHKDQVHRGVMLAVGFAFDVNAGTKPDAPMWMQNWGLGWFFRLLSEPRRLLGRYFYYNFMFLYLLARGFLQGDVWKPGKEN